MIDFNTYLEETSLGPIQRNEAEFIYSLVKTIKPSLIVEFGFLKGDSTICLIEGSNGYDSKIVSYDIKHHPNMDKYKTIYPNFNYFIKNQTEFESTDINNGVIDFLFIDASHDLNTNKEMFIKIKGSLSKDTIIAVHDTGLWNKKHMLDIHFNFKDGIWINDEEYAHRFDEIKFVKWLKEEYNYNIINIGSKNCLRHGISLLQL